MFIPNQSVFFTVDCDQNEYDKQEESYPSGILRYLCMYLCSFLFHRCCGRGRTLHRNYLVFLYPPRKLETNKPMKIDKPNLVEQANGTGERRGHIKICTRKIICIHQFCTYFDKPAWKVAKLRQLSALFLRCFFARLL